MPFNNFLSKLVIIIIGALSVTTAVSNFYRYGREEEEVLKIGPPTDTTCIGSKSGHQVATLADVANLATRLRQGRQTALDSLIGIISLY